MNDSLSLKRAIFTNPDEDTPRLMYADWLQENGDSSQAEFIRAQCELAKLQRGDSPTTTENISLGASLLKRTRLLFEANIERWLTELPGSEHKDSIRRYDDRCEVVTLFDTDYDVYYTYRRGFPEVAPELPVGMLTAGLAVWLSSSWNGDVYGLAPPLGLADEPPYGITTSGPNSDGMVPVMIHRSRVATEVALNQFVRRTDSLISED